MRAGLPPLCRHTPDLPPRKTARRRSHTPFHSRQPLPALMFESVIIGATVPVLVVADLPSKLKFLCFGAKTRCLGVSCRLRADALSGGNRKSGVHDERDSLGDEARANLANKFLWGLYSAPPGQ